MRTASLLLLALLSLPAAARTQTIVIAPGHRVPNTPHGCCGPSTLEAVALHAGHAQVRGLTASLDSRPYTATVQTAHGPRAVHPCHSHFPATQVAQARSYGVRTTTSPAGSYDVRFVRAGLADGVPVLVRVVPPNQTGFPERHVVAVAGWSAGTVRVYDPDRTGERYVTYPERTFRSRWDGSALRVWRR